MPSLSDVRTYPGVPHAGVFAASDGTPIVIDTTTDHAYYLASGNTVKALGILQRVGAFADTTTQAQAAINTPKAVTFNTTLADQGVAIGTPTSRIVPAYPGLYAFQFSLEMQSNNASSKNLWVWPRRSGVDIPNSNTKITVSGSGTTVEIGWAYPLTMGAGDYFELMWAVDDISLVIQSITAPAFGPAVPSALLTATQFS